MEKLGQSFKPCYKWMTFNTEVKREAWYSKHLVLNLVINGWPSIHILSLLLYLLFTYCFKPCYKWMTFNTLYFKKLYDKVSSGEF